MIDVFTLKNGIKVVTYQMRELKSIHLSLAVKGGSLGEQTGKNGVAHFMEHMLVQATESFASAQDLSFYVENLAGSYNAYTDGFTVSFTIRLPYIYLQDAIKISSEVFFKPTFPTQPIEKERIAIITEIAQRMDAQWYKLDQNFKKTRFTTNLLQKDTGGTLEDVQKITKKDMLLYWEKFFLPSNTYLFIGGNFEKKKLKQYLNEYFETISQKPKKLIPYPKIAKSDYANKGVFILKNDEYKTNYVDLSFNTIGFTQNWKDLIKQDLALALLGQFRTSRLFKLLRYQKGLLYGISAQKSLFPNSGLIHITYETPIDSLEEVTRLTTETLFQFMREGPTKQELEFAKRYFTNSWLMTFDNPNSVASWFEAAQMWSDKVRTPEDYIRMTEKITQKDVLDFMNKNWDLSKIQILIQGGLEDNRENREKYEQYIHI